MATYNGQLDRPLDWRSRNNKRWRRWAKNQMNRKYRRLAKQKPEDAPRRKRYNGYEL